MDTSNVTPLHGGIVIKATPQLSSSDPVHTPKRKQRHTYSKAHYQANREKILARSKAWRQANREKLRARSKAYYQANREKVLAHSKDYYQAKRRAEEPTLKVPRGAAPLGGYGNYSCHELARMCGVTGRTAQRWRRAGKAPAAIVIMLELLHRGPLELLSQEWADWAIRKGKLCNKDGHEYTPGEVWSIPVLHQRIAALEATIRQLRTQVELSDRFESQRDRSHRESKAIGKAEALCRVVFSLLGELTGSEDGHPPALDGSGALVRRLQLTACQVAIELHRGGSGESPPADVDAAIEAALAELSENQRETDPSE